MWRNITQINITQINITSPLYASSTAAVTPGTFTDIDGDTAAMTYQWYKNGVAQGGQTSTTLVLSAVSAIKGDKISVKQTATNSTWTTSSTSQFSTNTTVSNSAPASPSLVFTNATASNSFNVTGNVTDADGGTDIVAANISTDLGACSYLSNSTATTNFQAIFNCTSITAGTANINVGFTDASGAYASISGSNAYPNSPPVMNTSRILPAIAYTTSTLQGLANATDADGQNQTYFYTWYKNGIANQSGNATNLTQGIEYNLANFTGTLAVGDNFTFEVYSTDGIANSSKLNSSVVTITNSAPTITVQNTFTNASAGHSMLVLAGITDLDGASDIASTNISTSAGSCAYVSNLTSGNNFNVTYNCTATSPGTATIAIGFTDKSGAYVQSTASGNAYPDKIGQIIGASSQSCYQESANTPNQTGIDGSCGLNYSGSYATAISGPAIGWDNYSAIVDGDWGTSSTISDTNYGSDVYLYINYTKPANAINTSLWQMKSSLKETNQSIPASCWNQNPLQLRSYIYDGSIETDVYFDCWTGTGWTNLR
ncbi:MAG TPA: hypothetical protein PLO51_04090, partial [Candidatus Micrarchaeota archaeon]|nr:hypothetical protein [Candidatus Micrarchaeota archaeon]